MKRLLLIAQIILRAHQLLRAMGLSVEQIKSGVQKRQQDGLKRRYPGIAERLQELRTWAFYDITDKPPQPVLTMTMNKSQAETIIKALRKQHPGRVFVFAPHADIEPGAEKLT